MAPYSSADLGLACQRSNKETKPCMLLNFCRPWDYFVIQNSSQWIKNSALPNMFARQQICCWFFSMYSFANRIIAKKSQRENYYLRNYKMCPCGSGKLSGWVFFTWDPLSIGPDFGEWAEALGELRVKHGWWRDSGECSPASLERWRPNSYSPSILDFR